MAIYVALLRGINVGGNNLIKMAELRACFEKVGFRNVSTYINSGNALFETDKQNGDALELRIERCLGEQFGFTPKVVVRSREQMEQVIEHLPSRWLNATDQRCNVIFLKRSIDSPDLLNTLRIKETIEMLAYQPGVLYWSANTSDLTKSSMVKLSAQPLYQHMTIRNLNTTQKLYALMTAQQSVVS